MTKNTKAAEVVRMQEHDVRKRHDVTVGKYNKQRTPIVKGYGTKAKHKNRSKSAMKKLPMSK
jgi:hypothetical protein